jgi:hypothetical protein
MLCIVVDMNQFFREKCSSSTLKMEIACSSEKLVSLYQTTRFHIQIYTTFHCHKHIYLFLKTFDPEQNRKRIIWDATSWQIYNCCETVGTPALYLISPRFVCRVDTNHPAWAYTCIHSVSRGEYWSNDSKYTKAVSNLSFEVNVPFDIQISRVKKELWKE